MTSVRARPALPLMPSLIRDAESLVDFARVLLMVISVVSVLQIGFQIVSGLSRSFAHSMVEIVLTGFCFAPTLRRVWMTKLPNWLLALGIPLILVWGATTAALVSRVTMDATAVFVAMPVLFAAYELRAPAAALVTANAVTAATVHSFVLSPGPDQAVHAALFAGAGLVMLAIVVVVIRDQQEDVDRLMVVQAERDFLTGLCRRAVIERRLDDAVEALARPSSADPVTAAQSGLSLLLVDVDHFKRVNDTEGHVTGDRVLAQLAHIVSAAVADEGSAGGRSTLAGRWGGDEFAVVCAGSTAAEAEKLAERLVRDVSRRPFVRDDGSVLPLSITVGVGHLSPGRHEVDDIFHLADAGLYEAKARGRGRVGVG